MGIVFTRNSALKKPRFRFPCLLIPFWLMLLVLVGGGCAESTPENSGSEPALRFTVIPFEDKTRAAITFQPLADYLWITLNQPVKYVPVQSYAEAVELFAKGEIHLAWLGGLTGAQAVTKVPGATLLAQGHEDAGFYSYFIAHADTGLKRGDDFPLEFKGQRFSFGSKSSTSGRLMPEHFIRTLGGAAPEEFFSEVNFSGSHSKTVELVEAGEWPTAVVSYKTYDKRVRLGLTDPAVVKIIWKTPNYPNNNWIAHPALSKDFGAGINQRLTDALIAIDDPFLLKPFRRSGFTESAPKALEPIQKLALQLGLIKN